MLKIRRTWEELNHICVCATVLSSDSIKKHSHMRNFWRHHFFDNFHSPWRNFLKKDWSGNLSFTQYFLIQFYFILDLEVWHLLFMSKAALTQHSRIRLQHGVAAAHHVARLLEAAPRGLVFAPSWPNTSKAPLLPYVFTLRMRIGHEISNMTWHYETIYYHFIVFL